MTLNKQLLAISLLLLCLPWAGCQYLQEMEGILRTSQEQTLMASTRSIAAVFSQQAELLYPQGERYPEQKDPQQPAPLYFHPLPAPLWIDGYNEGWENQPAVHYPHPDNHKEAVRVQSGLHQQQLFLLLSVSDDSVIYNNPSRSLINDGDRVVLITGKTAYSFTSAAPGKVTARFINGPLGVYREAKISAFWRDTDQGYTLEIQLPLDLAGGKLGFYVIDQDEAAVNRYGQMPVKNSAPPLLIYQPPALAKQLAIFEQSGQRLSVIDPHYWTLSTTGQLEQHHQSASAHWLVRKLYRLLLDASPESIPDYGGDQQTRAEMISAMQGHGSSAWYRDRSRPNYRILASAAPIKEDGNIVGVIVAEQSSEQLTALTDSAFNRLLGLSFGAICIVALGLLGYASWLSWRIRRLSRAARDVINDEGKLLDNFPSSNAADEIGDLTRNYHQLLSRLGDYTSYLQTLSRKLSHELRTPLAIIHSSLDNLANQSLDSNSQLYQQRAKEGTLRLGNILTAMSEASRVEESIENSCPEHFNLLDLLKAVTAAYQDIYPNHRIRLQADTLTDSQAFISAIPDLLVQMLDKLVENASSFCPPGGDIIVACQAEPSALQLSVSNDGPLLPATMRGQLFDNMVSLRQEGTGDTHLGLGLHIVKLIAQSHNATLSAANRSDNSGVIFTVRLPRGAPLIV